MEPTGSSNSASPQPAAEQLGTNEGAAPDLRQAASTSDDHPLKFLVVTMLIVLSALALVWGIRAAFRDDAPRRSPSEVSKPPEPPAGSIQAIARHAVESLVNEGGARFRTMNLKMAERDRQELAKSPEQQRQAEETLIRLAELQDKRARREAEVKKFREEWRGAPDEKEKNKALDDLVRAENGMLDMTFDRLYVQLGPVTVFPWEFPATKGGVKEP
ncbi:MAG: hypothetical protein IT449_12980 [Phycisphaerales bacterium]|nr:hypothetical protein [Phycisphaerales bacterium]